MKFIIEEIKNKETWEDFLSECEEKTFLQSWNWGEFQKMMGEKIWRLGIYSNGELLSLALVIMVTAKRGTFLFLPHGPVIREQLTVSKEEILKLFLEKLKEIASKEKAIFIRISPIWQKNEENSKIFKDLGFKEAPLHIHPELTWELDIRQPEEKLLAGMRKTTRYLIRQAQKNPEVKISQENNISAVDIFNELYQETVRRHHFVPFSQNYLKSQFQAFSKDEQIAVFIGRYRAKVLASAILVFWQGITFYHHGASSQKYPKIPVSYLLQWKAIREAKRRGCQKYNFWGIAPEGKLSHPWQGLSLFKMGFGGYKKEYLKTQDLPLSKKYWLTFIFEKIRKLKRGF